MSSLVAHSDHMIAIPIYFVLIYTRGPAIACSLFILGRLIYNQATKFQYRATAPSWWF